MKRSQPARHHETPLSHLESMFQPLAGLKRDDEDGSGPPQALAVAIFADFSSRSPEKCLAKIATPRFNEYLIKKDKFWIIFFGSCKHYNYLVVYKN